MVARLTILAGSRTIAAAPHTQINPRRNNPPMTMGIPFPRQLHQSHYQQIAENHFSPSGKKFAFFSRYIIEALIFLDRHSPSKKIFRRTNPPPNPKNFFHVLSGGAPQSILFLSGSWICLPPHFLPQRLCAQRSFLPLRVSS
jgi:hypothetical protein